MQDLIQTAILLFTGWIHVRRKGKGKDHPRTGHEGAEGAGE